MAIPLKKPPLDPLSRKAVFLVMAWMLPTWIVFAYLTGSADRGFWAWPFSASLVYAAGGSWSLRTRVWFRAILLLLIAANAYVLLAFAWPTPRRGAAWIALPHYGLMRGVFWCFERVFEGRKSVAVAGTISE